MMFVMRTRSRGERCETERELCGMRDRFFPAPRSVQRKTNNDIEQHTASRQNREKDHASGPTSLSLAVCCVCVLRGVAELATRQRVKPPRGWRGRGQSAAPPPDRSRPATARTPDRLGPDSVPVDLQPSPRPACRASVHLESARSPLGLPLLPLLLG